MLCALNREGMEARSQNMFKIIFWWSGACCLRDTSAQQKIGGSHALSRGTPELGEKEDCAERAETV